MKTTEQDNTAYGFWQSPISGERLTQSGITLSYPKASDDTLFWLESRPAEKGRQVIVAQMADGTKRELLPTDRSARSQLLEYGGCPYFLCGEIIIWIEARDQNLYGLHWQIPDATPFPITEGNDKRFGDCIWDNTRNRLIAVMEDCSQDSQLSLVSINLPASSNTAIEPPQALISGADFYAYPTLSPDGNQLSWISWNHPAMPWDNTQCFLGNLNQQGIIEQVQLMAGADNNESITQPQFGPDGFLYWVSDRNNWWNIYRQDSKHPESLAAITHFTGECATPRWVSGMSCYGFLNIEQLLVTFSQQGRWYLAKVNIANQQAEIIESELDYFGDIMAQNNKGLFIAASCRQRSSIFQYENGIISIIETAPSICPPEYFSTPQNLTFASAQAYAYGFYYPPHNPDVIPPKNNLPPLIVIGHGGPTGATNTALNLKIQFWTSRGFAVLDVNYRGSTGFGREYRQSLQGLWGLADVEDLCAAAEIATQNGWVHPQQRFIKGSSAGGYSVLAALCFHDTFNAGVSLYGIGDLSLLATETHKFEARYLDSLVGPYPAQADIYYQRSPLNFAQQITCPLLVFQGLLDKVVPPNQAQQLVKAVREVGTPVTYIEFADEGHGFRQAVNIVAQLEAELEFYQGLLR